MALVQTSREIEKMHMKKGRIEEIQSALSSYAFIDKIIGIVA